MKKRTFFAMLILFLIFFNSMILVISLIMLNDKLTSMREKCLAEHYVIASTLIGDMQALAQRENDAQNDIDKLMQPYCRYLLSRKGGVAVSFSGEWIYKSSEMIPKDGSAHFADLTGTERIVCMEKEPSPQICVYGNFPAPWQDYRLLYIGDMSDMLSSWSHVKNGLFLMGEVAMFVMALLLFKFLNVIFRPLRQISSASAQIANGDYGRRLPVQGKDEVANVAYNFNLMAEQVEAHIGYLRDSADQKQQFIDNFAHELRIPLTAIYGYAEYIQKASISEEERYECTQFIMTECKRLQNMAYQLLDLALLRKIETEDCPVDVLFAQSEKVMQAKAMEKQIKLSYVLPGSEKAKEGREYSREPDGYSEGTYIVVEVKDYGIGMSPEQLMHVKEAFYRADKARSRAAGGAGLGLSICERIVQLHNAELTFVSELGKGTMARICFVQR